MKTKRFIFFIIIIISNIANCQFKRRTYNSGELNVVLKSEIGSDVYMQGQEDFQDAIKIVSCPEFNINFVKFPYKVGDILPYFKTRKNFDLYFNPSQKDYLDSGTIGIAFDKVKNIYVPYINSYNGFLTKDQKGKLVVENTTYTNSNCNECFKKVFIYNGKAGNIIKFTYREFINDMARPAFTQDLQYDLNEGKIVGLKGMRIEILNVSNMDIEFKILSPFN